MRLAQMLPVLLHWSGTGWPYARREDSQARQAFLIESHFQARRAIGLGTLLLLVSNAIFGLTDPWTFQAYPRLVGVMARGRVAESLLGLIVLLALWQLPHRALGVGITSGYTGTLILGYTLGRCGLPDTPWPYFILPFFLLTIGAWGPPWQRLLGVSALGVVACAALQVADPAMASNPMTPIAIGFLLFVVAMCVALGLYADHVRVHAFLATEDLARERAGLSERVQHQTHAVVALHRRLDAVREAERLAVSRNIHDELGQTLTAARLATRHTQERYERDPQAIGPNLKLLSSTLEQIATQTSDILSSLRTASVDARSLNGAVDALVRRTADVGGLVATYTGVDTPEPCSDATAGTAYRWLQEALTNVLKHAQATQVDVALLLDGNGHLLTRVRDDGVGFDPDVTTDRLGLLGMSERAAMAGGTMSVTSGPEGTTVSATFSTGGDRD